MIELEKTIKIKLVYNITNFMQYNRKKHFNLLKSLQKSENSRKNVSDEEFSKLLDSKPDENFLKLETYSAMLILSFTLGK